jgi:sigma-B regulation protein RsbU (phosphoserine phosphatase)
MHGFLLWLTFFLNLLLPAIFSVFLFINYRRRVKLRKERDTLLLEKEAAMGFVQNVGEVFADTETVDMDSLLARVLHYAVRTCKANSGAIHLVNVKKRRLEARAISGVFPPPFKTALSNLDLEQDASAHLEQLVKNTSVPLGKGLIGEAAVLGNAILVEDAEMDSRIPQVPVQFLKIQTLLVVPMRFGNHTIGVMTLANRTNGEHFALADLNLAQALAAQSSVPIHYAGLQEALEEKRQIDRDMHMAQQIQNSLLPQHLPTFPTVELAAFNNPAMDIGGDYYDFITIDEKHIGLAIADVSGKGIGGALMMAVCRSVLRANAKNVYDPASMLTSLNDTLSSNLPEDMFVSMLYMVLNLETHMLSYARAGHEAPIIIRNGESTADQSETAGIAIGLVDKNTFGRIIESRTISLRPGDLVVTYTDGITEAMNPHAEEWGTQNLIQSTERMADAPAGELLNSIRKEVLAFTGNNRQHDDMTMLALKIKDIGKNDG